MKYLLLFAFVILPASLIIFHFATRKYLNPYKLIFIIAKKGGGKTTTLTKMALQHLKHGWNVYATIPIPGCYFIDYEDIGPYEFLERSLIIIDEVGMVWDNRDFKNFSKSVRDWFKLQRHRKCKAIMASQDFDVDLKIRKLCDDMYLLVNKFRIFSYGKRIIRRIDIVEANGSAGSESRLVDQLAYDSLLFFWCGSRKLTYIPAWVKYFDSFDAPSLLVKEFQQLPPLSLDDNEKHIVTLVKKTKEKISFLKHGAEKMGCKLRLFRREDDE